MKLATIPKMQSECYEDLANEIILSAVRDYKHALRRGNDSQIQDCERFFSSQWFTMLTAIDPNVLMEKLRKEADNDNKRNKVVV